MFASSSLNLPSLGSSHPPSVPEPKPKYPSPSTISLQIKAEAPYEPDSKPQAWKLKGSGSPQLKRWSRARALRAGRKLDRPGLRSSVVEVDRQIPVKKTADTEPNNATGSDGESAVVAAAATATAAKSIYMVSDGTGWTAEHSVNAALGQFEHCLVDRGCPVHTHMFSGVSFFIE